MDGRGIKFSKIFALSAIIIIVAFVSSVHADIYMYIDANGVMHFTNAPTSNQHEYKVYLKERISVSNGFHATDKYDKLISNASKEFNVDSRLLKAMIKAESDFDPRAISRKGAMGLMQIMPENFKMLNIENPFDPWQNIRAGAQYFKKLYKRFNGKLALSLAAYNAGPTAVDRYKNIPPYQETEEYVREYVRRVLRYYRTFKQL
jgi:soluble lytic murein transglycosylase